MTASRSANWQSAVSPAGNPLAVKKFCRNGFTHPPPTASRRHSRLSVCATVLLLLASCQFPTQAAPVTITKQPAADASLIEVAPTNNNGAQAWILSGRTQNGPRNRGVLKFDLSDLPAGTVIQSVALTLEVTRVPDEPPVNSAFGLHRMLRSWGEGNKAATGSSPPGKGLPASPGEVTWTHAFYPTNAWSAPGGAADVDFSSVESSFQFVSGLGTYRFESTPEIVGDVQAWVDHPETNYGWLLLCGSEGVPFSARRFGSREDTNFPPVLEITYLPYLPFAIRNAAIVGHQLRFTFTVQAGKTCAVQFRDQATAGTWQTLTQFPAPTADTDVVVLVPLTAPQRFYRLLTP